MWLYNFFNSEIEHPKPEITPLQGARGLNLYHRLNHAVLWIEP